eukprot:scaffold1637_cov410-Prasinococcus_capsulatus_cf.AAC.27
MAQNHAAGNVDLHWDVHPYVATELKPSRLLRQQSQWWNRAHRGAVAALRGRVGVVVMRIQSCTIGNINERPILLVVHPGFR